MLCFAVKHHTKMKTAAGIHKDRGKSMTAAIMKDYQDSNSVIPGPYLYLIVQMVNFLLLMLLMLLFAMLSNFWHVTLAHNKCIPLEKY